MERARFRLRLGCAGAALVIAAALAPAHAQSQKVARLVIGFPPGASFDAVGRMITDKLRGSLGQTFIVENRPGATGTIGADAVARAAPDGMTLLLTPLASMVTEPQVNKNVRYDPFKDLVPVSLVATFEIAMGVGPAVSATTLREYVATVKADRSKGFFGSPGPNSLPHFFGLTVGRATGAEMTHVPFAGPAQALQTVLGGQVPAVIAAYPDLLAFHRSGKMRMLAMTGAQRSRLTPDVPTFKELGYDVEATPWYAIFAPARTPPEVVGRINAAVGEAIRSKEISEFLVSTGHQPQPTTPSELGEILKRDYGKWGAIIRASGIKLE